MHLESFRLLRNSFSLLFYYLFVNAVKFMEISFSSIERCDAESSNMTGIVVFPTMYRVPSAEMCICNLSIVDRYQSFGKMHIQSTIHLGSQLNCISLYAFIIIISWTQKCTSCWFFFRRQFRNGSKNELTHSIATLRWAKTYDFSNFNLLQFPSAAFCRENLIGHG